MPCSAAVRPVARRTARRTLTLKVTMMMVVRNLAQARRVAESAIVLY
jgi:ABC-type phosphate transport system ATPase subunit